MSATETLNVGVVGAYGRGGGVASNVQHVAGARLLAACDTNAEKLPEAQERTGATEVYTDYEEMLEKKGTDTISQ